MTAHPIGCHIVTMQVGETTTCRIGSREFTVTRRDAAVEWIFEGKRGAVYGTMRFQHQRNPDWTSMYLVNGHSGKVDPLGSELVIRQTGDSLYWSGTVA